jgi:hypothetical protein
MQAFPAPTPTWIDVTAFARWTRTTACRPVPRDALGGQGVRDRVEGLPALSVFSCLPRRIHLASNPPKRMTPLLRPRTTLAGSNQVAGRRSRMVR